MAVAEAPAKGRRRSAATVDPQTDWPYRFELVPLDELHVDAAYQRPLTTFWKKVHEDFNPALVGTLIVSEKSDGTKNVIDGQTRLTAMREQGLLVAPCLVYERLSQSQEARLFSDLQTKRRAMRSYDRFRAQMVAKEPAALEIAKIVKAIGFELDVEEVPGKTIKAIAALEKAYRVDPDHLADVLEILRDIWGTDNSDAVNALMITGMSTFLLQQDRIDRDRLISRLKDVTPKLIINRSAQIREGNAGGSGGRSTSVATAITQEYMRRR